MNDPIAVMIRLISYGCWWIGWALGGGLIRAVIAFFRWLGRPRRMNRKEVAIAKKEQKEDERMAECRNIVFWYVNHFGWIAREAMTRAEIEERIDKGISGYALEEELKKRIDSMPAILLGKRQFQDGPREIRLPYSLRDRHCYLIGRSGSGKTNLIRFMLLQDILFGCGVGVLAPEAELLTDEILPYIPENRIDHVVYVDPDDPRCIAFNPLHLDEGERIEQKVEDFVTIFKRAVGDTGFRMDQILSNTLYALISHPGSTLDDFERFLSRNNPAFRNEVLKTADEKTRFFFEETYPTMDRNAAIPVITRLSAFTRREAVRNVLCQPGESFNFRRAIDEGKILLFNVSDGILGEAASQLLGQIIISKMQLAVFSRADTSKRARRPFYLYLDEFQSFIGVNTDSYKRLLSRSRKYAFGLVLANQQTHQLSSDLLHEILGNVTTLISFSVSHDDANKLSHEFSYEEGGKITYVEPGEFQRSKTGETIVKIGRNAFPMQTVLLPNDPDHDRAAYIIEKSRRNYGKGSTWRVDIKPPELPRLPPPGQDDNDKDDIDPRRFF